MLLEAMYLHCQRHESGDIELSLLNYSVEPHSVLKEEEKKVIQKYSLVDHGNFIAQEKLSFYTEENKTKIQKYCDDNKGNFYVISLVVPVLYNMFPKLLKFSAGLYPCFVWEFDALPKAWSESIQMVIIKW